MAGMALPFGFGAQQQQQQKKPAPATPPQSTDIGDTTYVNLPQQPKSPWDTGTDRGAPGGSMFGADGSVWAPQSKTPYQPGGEAKQPAPVVDMNHMLWVMNNQGGGDVPRVPGITDADRRGAEDAAFARAKDRIGLATQGLLRSVQNRFARRGLRGSGLERSAEMDAMESGAGQLGEVVRDQAIEGLRRQNQVADQTYQGDITQRGQDLSALAQRRQSILALLKMAESGGAY